MADISKITTLDGTTYDIKDILARQAIPFGVCDSTSTSTAFTATVPGITVLADGTCVLLQNSRVTSASGFTININGLGAKPVYSNMSTGNDITPTAPTQETTLFNINYTMLFIYSTTLVDGGCWILYRGYNSNDNTIGYQLRTNSTVLKTADKSRYYRLFFTSANGTHWVPANTGTDNSATSKKTVNQRPINPFGRIIYFSANTNMAAEANVSAGYCWSQYAFALGYSFNTTGAALTLTTQTPVYIKCAPQNDGSAIIDATTPYVQDLPSTEDGKIYIFLGIAYSATNVELYVNHPIYEYKNGAIRLYTNAAVTGSAVDPATETPIVAGTGAVGTSTKYAREDHVHPAQTTINGHTVNSDVPTNAQFTDTTYESKTAASGGTDVSLVTTGEKYTWNNKGTYSKPSGGIPDSDIASAATWNAKGNGTITGITMNGASKGTSGVVDLGTVITAHQDISGKADKSATVSNVAYNSTSKKITETINGTTSDVVTVATLKTDLALAKADVGLSNVDNVQQYSASNPPPYPVTSVNGDTGAVTVAVPSVATAVPLMDGTAAVGTSVKYAREDHVHPTDTSRQAALVSGTNIKTINNTSLLGSGDITVQPTLVSGTNIKTINNTSILGSGNISTPTVPAASTTTPLMDGTATYGSSTAYAREDHRHPSDTNKVSTASTSTGSEGYINYTSGYKPRLVSIYDDNDVFPQAELLVSGNTGIELTYGPQEPFEDAYESTTMSLEKTNISLSITDNTGTYVNELTMTPTETTIHNVVWPESSGDAASKAYVDSISPSSSVLPANTTPQNLGTAAIGTSTRYARADHVHNLPQQLGSIVFGTSWTAYTGYYTQSVTVTGATITGYSKVDLQASAAVLATLMDAGTSSIYIENNNSVLTAYLIGTPPTASFTLQCTVTLVKGASS